LPGRFVLCGFEAIYNFDFKKVKLCFFMNIANFVIHIYIQQKHKRKNNGNLLVLGNKRLQKIIHLFTSGGWFYI